jgi:hypothetical protein
MLHTSAFWEAHFRENLTHQRIDWSVDPTITEAEKAPILRSLQAWQLGETSEGRQLLAAAKRFARRIDDPAYVDAIRLFIREEQKHGANLGRYLDRIGEPRLKRDLGDSLFRRVRHFNTSMEAWTITVIIVESAAQLFYQALHDATTCPLLRAICTDILIDEAHHIKFQNERMQLIFGRKGFYNKAFSLLAYSTLFFGTLHAIWAAHGKAFRAGGVDRTEFMRRMYYKFFGSMRFLHDAHPARPVLAVG